MNNSKQELDENEIKRLASHGVELLRSYHREREKDPAGRDTEFRRGHVAEWRHLLRFIYGQRIAESIAIAASDETTLTIPHSGPLDKDGRPIHFDSGAHL